MGCPRGHVLVWIVVSPRLLPPVLLFTTWIYRVLDLLFHTQQHIHKPHLHQITKIAPNQVRASQLSSCMGGGYNLTETTIFLYGWRVQFWQTPLYSCMGGGYNLTDTTIFLYGWRVQFDRDHYILLWVQGKIITPTFKLFVVSLAVVKGLELLFPIRLLRGLGLRLSSRWRCHFHFLPPYCCILLLWGVLSARARLWVFPLLFLHWSLRGEEKLKSLL